jgi:hypothetical protein
MASKATRTARQSVDLVADTLAQLLQQQTDAITSDDTPLPEEAVPAAIHFIEAIQYGGLTEAQYKEQYRENWNILMRELDPNYIDPQTPAQQPEQRRRSRLL